MTAATRLNPVFRPLATQPPSSVFQKSVGAGITITDQVGGNGSIRLFPADTADLPSRRTQLYFDLEITLGGEVYTIASGRLIVEPDITVR